MPVLEKIKNASVWTEFKEFISQGSVLQLGVGIIIGGAFSSFLNSFVNDILSPPLGLLISGSNLENYFIILRKGRTPNPDYKTPAEAQADGAVTENVGLFIMNGINFLLVGVSLFLIVFTANRLRDFRKSRRSKKHGALPESADDTKPEPAPASGATQTCPWCNGNVPVKAVKCMYCTSFLHEKVPAELLNRQPQAALIELDG
ncbi:hypothetical protein CPC16_001999 [Podila verticillata]|nr:hypothetical protein BGZ52_007355 [Haplosporangium bisporale]KAF9217133.1 hypothetical protein BGZ59_006300 [Podila verticillata]KAF9393447.1 hypothetical protein CPC16_001999 [Podila verticillata]KAI9234479.1 MAG: large-conductance mechanosensitive channel [Podila humilis]KFH73176.1 hypothetical protein MVEG_00397 [Podila verticillata NRRL 6337]